MTDPADRPSGDAIASLVLRWPTKVMEEVLLAPWTIARVRRSLTELPDKIDTLSEALDRSTTDLGANVDGLAEELLGFKESLDQMLPALSLLVTGMDERVEHLEVMMFDLGESLLGVLGAIPGVRRRIQSTPRPVKTGENASGAGGAPPAPEGNELG